ncbi:ameloblastin [Melanotaenia boesemani]|uniref:ameloblastin n=1 Tax=Melanotaenia boesemani TaxID=1250792 RepID=UPI001C0545CD|nr:ameloblastin [Melanotaenia boesemani]
MITILLVLCPIILVSAVPVGPHVHPPQLSQGETTQKVQPVEATNQIPEAQSPAPLSPVLEQPNHGTLQQPNPQGSAQASSPLYMWFPQGGSPVIIPLYQSAQGSLPANQLTQQPLIFPPYGFLPVPPSPYGNQPFPQYGFPMIFQSSVPPSPANQLPNSPMLPAEPATPLGAAPQQTQQNPSTAYTLQQLMNPSLGGLSSEELETVAKMGQLGLFMPTVLTNPPAGGGAVQPQSQAAGLKSPEQHGTRPAVGSSTAGVPSLQRLACSGSQPDTKGLPAGLEKGAAEASIGQTPGQPKLGNLV